MITKTVSKTLTTSGSAGSTTRELIRMIGGPRGANLFNHEEIVRLFDKMATGMVEDDTEKEDRKRPKSRFVTARKLIPTLQRCQQHPQYLDNHLAALLRTKILRLGRVIECTVCGQRNWYALADILETLTCQRCLERFPFPVVHPDQNCDWAYRVQGPFATEGCARGAYAVGLLLRILLDEFQFQSTTWLPGVEMTWEGRSIEADLVGFFRRDTRFRHVRTWMLLAECKSFGNFEKKDFERARILMEKFPDSVFCFATLKGELGSKEKAGIATLAQWGRKAIASERWRNPVMVLTGRELFSESIHQAWTEAGGKFEHLIRYYQDQNEVQWFSEATQMAYLDLPSSYQQTSSR